MQATQDIHIFGYENYRTFLRDFYECEKAKRPDVMSFRYLSRLAGFASSNAIHLIMRNQRNLSLQSARRVARALKLKRREQQFFEQLVQFNQSRCPEEKQEAYRAMQSYREYREARGVGPEQYELFSTWYIPVIREMVNLAQFEESPQWIAKHIHPRITPQDAAKALEKLLDTGLLVRDDSGRLRQADAHIASTPEIQQTALLNFHNTMITHSAKALQYPSSVRDISGMTISLPSHKFRELQEIIHNFHGQLQQFVEHQHDQDSDQIYQVNVQVFPFVTARRKSESKS